MLVTTAVYVVSVWSMGCVVVIPDQLWSIRLIPWWRHQMETFSALLAICAGNSPVPGEFPAQRPVTRSFDVFFDLHLNKRLNIQWWGWWFETLSRPLWRHRNALWPSDAYICVSKLTIISSDNGLSSGRHQAIIWTNAGILLIRNLEQTPVKP